VFFTYFNPPKVIDVEPLLGPVKGNTIVNLWGNSFERRNITCLFGKIEGKGTYISKEHI